MTWAQLIVILLEVIKQRSEAGWPVIKALIELFGKKIEAQVPFLEGSATQLITAAAPDELKEYIIGKLKELQSSAGLIMKGVYSLLIQVVPLVIDQVWDRLFTLGHVQRIAADYTPISLRAAFTPNDEEALFAAADVPYAAF